MNQAKQNMANWIDEGIDFNFPEKTKNCAQRYLTKWQVDLDCGVITEEFPVNRLSAGVLKRGR